jgi:hypothetical protein
MAQDQMRVEITDEAVIVYRPPGRTKGGCVVPQGIEGEINLLDCLQALDGFDNEMLIKAMASHENQRFLCWERPEG